ncbi:MAG: FAD:protein FMN transferase [Proteobacteria bacterium]|nr:FAD:protein FMN transferase [Pseudomonadota bacterium]
MDEATAQGALKRTAEGLAWTFSAMASPCEVHVETDDEAVARAVGVAVEAEARRIERKYSRYRDDSLIGRINHAAGASVAVDPETAALLDYAAQCHALSGGRFDITSGALRRVWKFDGSDRVPDSEAVDAILSKVGWDKVGWADGAIVLPAGMEIDLGGLGKEYAVDTATAAGARLTDRPLLVNFGGDLRASGPRRDGARWNVALESPDQAGATDGVLSLASGALATSGDARRFLLKDGVRYAHILDPTTGWPVRDPPRSVTVAAETCLQAGLYSTLAMLHGAQAEAFLQGEGVQAWVIR